MKTKILDYGKSIRPLLRHYGLSASILNRLLSTSLTVERSAALIREGIASRESNFLTTLRKCVYENPSSPYRALLDCAGYSLADVESLVRNLGMEAALQELYRHGVYIEIQEFKGKKPAKRGERTFSFKESDFNNPLLTSGLATQTGGSTGASTKIKVPLEFIYHNSLYGIHATSLYGIPGKKVIVWLPILPALEGLFFNLRFGIAGNSPVKWFSQVDGRQMAPPLLERIKTETTILMSRFHRVNLPRPEYVDIQNTGAIARWMNKNLGDGAGFAVVTYASSALRLIMEARKEGLSLGPTVFWLMGEPLTPKKHEEIESYGCKAYTLYGCNELMLIGQACINPQAVDDIHVAKDKLAVIQHSRKMDHADTSVDAFLFTTLLDISPKIFLNTEIGDYGVLEKRSCGCPYEELGFTEHIHTIRSFEKLTAEGMTFDGNNMIALVESLLPARFGGNPAQYQLVEMEDRSGYTRLYILVSPQVGAVDEAALKETIFEGLFADADPSYVGVRVMKDVWSKADTIQVKRVDPIPTARGKVMPFYVCKNRSLLEQDR